MAVWKDHERAIAKRLGGKRSGPQGQACADVVHPVLSIECKERKSLPLWLMHAMGQAEDAASGGKLPAVVLHQLGRRHDEDLVVVRLKDFERMTNELSMWDLPGPG